jgi:dynein heavy chain
LYATKHKDKIFKRMNFSSATTPFNFYEAITQAAP